VNDEGQLIVAIDGTLGPDFIRAINLYLLSEFHLERDDFQIITGEEGTELLAIFFQQFDDLGPAEEAHLDPHVAAGGGAMAAAQAAAPVYAMAPVAEAPIHPPVIDDTGIWDEVVAAAAADDPDDGEALWVDANPGDGGWMVEAAFGGGAAAAEVDESDEEDGALPTRALGGDHGLEIYQVGGLYHPPGSDDAPRIGEVPMFYFGY
ncbi:MAG: hypothetical protein RLN62_02305, partial [Rickettsiales bacterium]